MNTFYEELKESITLKQIPDRVVDFTTLNKEALNQWLNVACKNGDLSLARYLLTSEHLPLKANIHGQLNTSTKEYDELPLLCAVKNNHKQLVDYLCTQLFECANLRYNNDFILQLLAKDNNIEMIEYLVNNDKIKNRPHITKDFINKLCVQADSLETFKYFLHSKDYNIKINDDYLQYLLTQACKHGQLETTQYLLTTPDLSNNPAITFELLEDACFTMFAANETAMVDYLFSEHNLLFKQYLEDCLKINNNKLGLQYIIDFDHAETLNLLLSCLNNNTDLQELICLCANEDLIEYIINDWNIAYTDNMRNFALEPTLRSAFISRELKTKLDDELDNKLNNKLNNKPLEHKNKI